jgi:hypothetical protein
MPCNALCGCLRCVEAAAGKTKNLVEKAAFTYLERRRRKGGRKKALQKKIILQFHFYVIVIFSLSLSFLAFYARCDCEGSVR